ncbi:MAG: hypoxanthine phosphoribosyltransferase [Eubacteriales bacterium]|nr:hypoxanthine phosphoribosyltransferase [Eubacteriales bacterium]
MKKYVVEKYLNEEEIVLRIKELAAQINRDYKGKDLILVCILKGAVSFMAELMKYLDVENLNIDFFQASSYGSSTESSGIVKVTKDLDISIENKEVLIVEDILDTGNTLNYIKSLFIGRQPKSVKIVVLLDKKERRTVPFVADYVGFDIPDEFVVGFGIDYAEKHRELPYIGIVKFIE